MDEKSYSGLATTVACLLVLTFRCELFARFQEWQISLLSAWKRSNNKKLCQKQIGWCSQHISIVESTTKGRVHMQGTRAANGALMPFRT